MTITNGSFELLKEGKPLCLEGFWAFRDYVFTNIETKEKIKVRCATRFGSMSSFERIN